ncbi:MAG: hypothetical protein INH41_03595, partial [Myxococcaceae bacterium]|nr:hypothetical protein [Myxococcaceae bacterium]
SSVPDAQGSIIVSLDGARVPFDETGQQGWRWTDRDNGELTLVGDVCTRAIARPASIVVSVTCSAP